MQVKKPIQSFDGKNKSTSSVHHLDRYNVFNTTPLSIQPKLKINSPGDRYEQEADNIADKVVHMSPTSIQPRQHKSENITENTSQQRPLAAQISTLIVSGTAQRKCPKCEEEEEKQVLQTKSNLSTTATTSTTLTNQIQQSNGSGRCMDTNTKSFMESRFGVDFSNVRIHTNSTAQNMNREINARAFTVGNNIYFNQGQYNPDVDTGKKLLAHELTHTVQQGNREIEKASIIQLKQKNHKNQSDSTTKLHYPLRTNLEFQLGQSLPDIRIHSDINADRLAQQQNAIAFTAGRDIYLRRGAYRPKTPLGDWILAHEVTHAVQQGQLQAGELSTLPKVSNGALESQANLVASGYSTQISDVHPPAIMPLTLAQFQAQLGTTPEQTLAINTLFANPTFAAILTWLSTCTAAPTQDVGPIALRVTPGLTIGGAVRFGGYSPMTRTLEINPTKPEHISNPAEMVDTIFHELIHAADDVNSLCQNAGSNPAPLSGAATSTQLPRRFVSPARAATLNRTHGPGASNPCAEFIDINSAAQSMVVNAIQANIQTTGIGHPTLTYVNVIIRNNPTALAFYERCRIAACRLSGSARSNALSTCTIETIAKFLPNSLLPSLLPAHLHFGSSSTRINNLEIPKLNLVARFLIHHPGTTVEIVGHTDASGDSGPNQILGQRRANAVRAELIRKGVPAAQIRRARSEGERNTISSSRRERFRDRRVVISP